MNTQTTSQSLDPVKCHKSRNLCSGPIILNRILESACIKVKPVNRIWMSTPLLEYFDNGEEMIIIPSID